MSDEAPLAEMASRIMRGGVKDLSPKDALDDHLRSEKCMGAAKLASIFGCSAYTINRLRAAAMWRWTCSFVLRFDGSSIGLGCR